MLQVSIEASRHFSQTYEFQDNSLDLLKAFLGLPRSPGAPDWCVAPSKDETAPTADFAMSQARKLLTKYTTTKGHKGSSDPEVQNEGLNGEASSPVLPHLSAQYSGSVATKPAPTSADSTYSIEASALADHDKDPKKSPKNASTYWEQCLQSSKAKSDLIDPDASFSRAFGSKTGWLYKGALVTKWILNLLPKIDDILHAPKNEKYIQGNANQGFPFVVELWMMSETKNWKDAEPTIVALCADAKAAKRMVRVLTNVRQFQDLNLGFHYFTWAGDLGFVATSTASSGLGESMESDSISLCGSRVKMTSIPISVKSQWNTATIGGVLYLDGAYYGLTAAHAFYSSRSDPGSLSQGNQERSSDSSGEDSEDEEDLHWLSSTDSSPALIHEPEEASATAESYASAVFTSRPSTVSDADGERTAEWLANLSPLGFFPKPGLRRSNEKQKLTSPDDLHWLSYDLDWALVRLHDARFWGRNRYVTEAGQIISPTHVGYSPPEGEMLIAAAQTHDSGERRFQCSSRKSGLMIPGARSLQEVWSVQSFCAKGDSGAWVIDPNSGCVYGMVVASSKELNVSYIMPACRILQDISEKSGGAFGGPDDMFPKEDVVPWISVLDEDVIDPHVVTYPYFPPTDNDADLAHDYRTRIDRPAALSVAGELQEGGSFVDEALGSDRASTIARESQYLPGQRDKGLALPMTPVSASDFSSMPRTSLPEPLRQVELLDYRFHRRENPERFFQRGRVLALLWDENGTGDRHTRRMVVVKEGHGYCWCLPINTYAGKGVSRPGFSKEDRKAHAIIYMSDVPPVKLADEKDLTKKEIAVDKAAMDQKLDHASRVDFRKIYTINHDAKVINVGKVSRTSMPYLMGYFGKSMS